jgi:hypothetical protein
MQDTFERGWEGPRVRELNLRFSKRDCWMWRKQASLLNNDRYLSVDKTSHPGELGTLFSHFS